MSLPRGAGALLMALCSAACPGTIANTAPRGTNMDPELKLAVEGEHLALSVENHARAPLRIWSTENSWGWWSIWLEVRAGDRSVEIRRKERDFTRNVPRTIEVAPGGRESLALDLRDGWWEVPPEAAALAGRQVDVRAHLHIDPTPESARFDVWVGSVASDWSRGALPL